MWQSVLRSSYYRVGTLRGIQRTRCALPRLLSSDNSKGFDPARDIPISGRIHDVGGDPNTMYTELPKGASDADTAVQDWEKRVHASLGILTSKGIMTTDELRYGIEQLPESSHLNFSYYEKWASSMLQTLLKRGVINHRDVELHIYGIDDNDTVDASKVDPFAVGTVVRVRNEDEVTRWKKPHLRTPGYLFGLTGVVERVAGRFKNPELLAFHQESPEQWLYRVRFRQSDVWNFYEGNENDTLDVEVYHPWLVEGSEDESVQRLLSDASIVRTDEEWKHEIDHHSCEEHVHHHHGEHEHHHHGEHEHHHHGEHEHHHHGEHEHHHDEPHRHETREKVEVTANEREGDETAGQRISHGFVKLLLAKNLITPKELHAAVEAFDMFGADHQGARLVARAWVDEDFKQRLLRDGNEAAKEVGIMASNAHTHTKLVVVENTPSTHNLVVCTLCSCYPIGLLGPSPSWYKSRSYRARAVREPRKLLREEFGLDIDPNIQVRVHDSTADCRYFVLPQRPTSSKNLKTEEELVQIVTRNSLIGVAVLE